MKKNYIHIYIALIIALVGFVIGSFFDFQISESLFASGGADNKFGLTISVLGPIFGYSVLAFLAGGFIVFGYNNKFEFAKSKALRICLIVFMYVFAVALYGCSVYFTGREFFGPNGFQHYTDIKRFYGYFIAAPIDLGIAFVGFLAAKHSDNKKLWIYYLIISVLFALALVAGVSLFKVIFNRPRFRSLGNGLDFYPWYVPCKEKDFFVNSGLLTKEEFKSFPSGHAGGVAAFMMFILFLPYINKKYEKYVVPMYYATLAWALLVSFARIYVGAHHLSDVSMGMLLSIVIFFIGKVVIDNNKYLSGKSTDVEEAE